MRLEVLTGITVWSKGKTVDWIKNTTLTIIFSNRSLISFSERFMDRSSNRGWGMGSSVWGERGSVGCWMRGFSFFIPVFLKLVMRSRWKKTECKNGLSTAQTNNLLIWYQMIHWKKQHVNSNELKLFLKDKNKITKGLTKTFWAHVSLFLVFNK